MLQQNPSNQECSSKLSQNLLGIEQSQPLPLNFKRFYFKKSLFSPPAQQIRLIQSRKELNAIPVPQVEFVFTSKRWIILQAPRYEHNFFRKLARGKLSHPCDMLLRIFRGFVQLTRIFGFFRPTRGMVFMEGCAVCVWINQDLFSNHPMLPIPKGLNQQEAFVAAFLAMVEGALGGWEILGREVTGKTIAQVNSSFEKQMNQTLGISGMGISREVQYRSQLSLDSRDFGDQGYYSQKLKNCHSVQQLQKNPLEYFQRELSNSLTIKEEERGLLGSNDQIFKTLYDSKDLKHSIYETKPGESSEIRKTKKKFNLTSTSSTLERFSDKFRSTVGKRGRKQQREEVPRPESGTIANELDGLFEEEACDRDLRLGVEGDYQQLEKIAQEMEEILIW